MPLNHRCLRFITVASVTTMLVMPALAAAQAPNSTPAATGGDFCIYLQGRTDTPEVGPLPCDTSRPYMIGHSGFGSSRIPADSEFSYGPKSHLDEGGSGAASSGPSEPADGSSASPGDATSERSTDIEAP
jgi:hypothetical protein